ncbi:hypothetical protein ACE6H2_021989 [Prunus campanulata]
MYDEIENLKVEWNGYHLLRVWFLGYTKFEVHFRLGISQLLAFAKRQMGTKICAIQSS